MSQLVYFSSSSENTQRFIERLGLPAVRIPLNERERIQVDEPYILIVPSYGGGGTTGAVPRQVIRFLNDEHNRALLRDDVMRYGIYNQNLQAVPPTGSISYINHATSSIHPIVAKVEIRKEGKTGRVYYPAPFMTNENLALYQDAYEIGAEKIIDTYAEATRHVDQGLSLTLFFPDTATTRDINKAQIYAWRKGIKTLYYIRLRQMALEGTEIEGCVSCAL